MRVKSAALCVSIALVHSPIAAEAQSAKSVIERHIKAIGGEKAVEAIVSTEMSGRITSADGRSGVFSQRASRPQQFAVSLSWGDTGWRAGFNGRSAWQEDSVDGLRTLHGEAASRVRAEARYANTRLLVPEKVSRGYVAGREELRGRPVIVIVTIASDGTKRTLFFDAATYLLVKDEQQTEAGLDERYFDDYRPVDRVMEPHRVEWRRNGETLRIVVDRITHNAPLDRRLFDVPSAPAEPPLDVETLLSAAGANERKAETVRTSYAYTQAMSARIVEGQGGLTPKVSSAFEVFHLGGQPVGRLIRKFNGQPLSEAERRREDERVNTIVREYERQRQSGKAWRPSQEFASGFALGSLWGSIVLRVPVMTTGWFPAYRQIAEFSHIRREQVRGRAAIVLEFEPKKNAAPMGDVERQVATMAGTLWIDEASQQVIRIESYFFDEYNAIAQGSSIWMEQTLVNGEVWLPSRLETNLRRSLGFGALAQPLITLQFTDHKKFGVETDSQIALPDAAR